MKYDVRNLMMGLDFANKSSTMHVFHCPRNKNVNGTTNHGWHFETFWRPFDIQEWQFPIENGANGPLHKLLSVFQV